MGEIFYLKYSTSAATGKMEVLDTIGWAQLYTKNGWETRGVTNIEIRFPNGEIYRGVKTKKVLEDGDRVAVFDEQTIEAGYKFLRDPNTPWKPYVPSTSIREPERRVPNYNAMGL